MMIELDVHGLSVSEAIYKIQRVIVNNPKCDCLEVIHGYNNGQAIKNELRNKNNIHSKRVLNTYQDEFNAGKTVICLKVMS